MIVEDKNILRWIIFPAASDLVPALRTVYLQCSTRTWILTHKREVFPTYIIDLKKSPEELFAGYSSKLRQHIRRAQEASLSIERDEDPTELITLFRPITKEQHLNPINAQVFDTKQDFIITRAVHPTLGILAAHAYQYDYSDGKVRGLYNASAFRQYQDNQEARNLCSQANALLYHEDFAFFRQQGFHTYDFGGYSMGATPGTDYFKDRFKGEVVTQYNYFPWWYFALRIIRNWWRGR